MGPDLRERAARATQAVLLSGRLPLAGLTSAVPTAGKSSITSNTTTSGSNSAVSAEGRRARPLLPPHSPALLSGDFRLPAPSIHHVFLLGRYEKTGRSFRGWQITQGTPTPCHTASHQIPEISAPAAQGCTLQPPTLTSPIFWLSSNHLFEHQLKGWAPVTLQRQHVRSAAAPPAQEVCRCGVPRETGWAGGYSTARWGKRTSESQDSLAPSWWHSATMPPSQARAACW